MTQTIKKFLVNGQAAEVSKSALSDEVTSTLLPTTTIEDAGKVPTVQEDGSYALTRSGVFVVHDNDGTLDKTFAEIVDAFGRGTVYIPKTPDADSIFTFTLCAGALDARALELAFIGFNASGESSVLKYGATSKNSYPVLRT